MDSAAGRRGALHGFVATLTAMTGGDDAHEVYEAWAPTWEADLVGGYGYTAHRIAAEGMAGACPERAAEILDVGCGTGLVGVNGIGLFLGEDDVRTSTLADHVEYLLDLVGPDHVGIGLDYFFEADVDASFQETLAENEDYWPRAQYPGGRGAVRGAVAAPGAHRRALPPGAVRSRGPRGARRQLPPRRRRGLGLSPAPAEPPAVRKAAVVAGHSSTTAAAAPWWRRTIGAARASGATPARTGTVSRRTRTERTTRVGSAMVIA